MEDLDFVTVFKEVAKESDLQDIVNKYRNIIDQRAFTAVFKAAFEAVVEKKPVEEVNERCMEVIKDYIVPRGKMTLAEYTFLLESLGNIFLKYVENKIEHTEFDRSNKSTQVSPSTVHEQPKINKKENKKTKSGGSFGNSDYSNQLIW